MKKIITIFISVISSIITGFILCFVYVKKSISQKENKIKKFKTYYYLLNDWIRIKQNNLSIEDYFKKHQYKSIAIYGMGELGERLYDELYSSENILIKYGIDRNDVCTCNNLKIFLPEDSLPEVDVIIVTAIFDFENIKKMLKQTTTYPIISIKDVISEI